MLSEEQISQIKEQLIFQINSTFPEDKKQSAIAQIESMNSEQLEQFLVRNKLVAGSSKQQGSPNKCVFCSIISGENSSYPIEENKEALAILEINPISNGHILVLPKKHISSSDKLPKSVLSLVKKVSKRIKSKLKPKDVLIHSANLFGHEIINLIPIYKNENSESERKTAKPEKLEELKNLLEKKERKKVVRKPAAKKVEAEKNYMILPKRIP